VVAQLDRTRLEVVAIHVAAAPWTVLFRLYDEIAAHEDQPARIGCVLKVSPVATRLKSFVQKEDALGPCRSSTFSCARAASSMES
jgi:hypothetical protein